MFISTAYAQDAAAAGGGSGMMFQLMPLLLIFVIFWFFLIRPQQKKAKDHREMVQNLKRGDQVLTSGGIIGRVTRVLDEATLQVEIADNVRVRVARDTVSQVMARTGGGAKAGKPAEDKAQDKADEKTEEKTDGAESDESAAAPSANAEGGGKKSMFSFGSKK